MSDILSVAGHLLGPVVTALSAFRESVLDLQDDEQIDLSLESDTWGESIMWVILNEPVAHRIVSLCWFGETCEFTDVGIADFLNQRCPALTTLNTWFSNECELKFYASFLAQPGNRTETVKLTLEQEPDADVYPSFFAALDQSRVVDLELTGYVCPEFARYLLDYLKRDRLRRFAIRHMWELPGVSALTATLAECTRLEALEFCWCCFDEGAGVDVVLNIPTCVVKLTIDDVRFANRFDWSFIPSSRLQELELCNVRNVNCVQLGIALKARLQAGTMDRLCIAPSNHDEDDIDIVMCEIGELISQVKCLDAQCTILSNRTFETLAAALLAPDSALKTLRFVYNNITSNGVKRFLAPAMKHPACALVEMSVYMRFHDDHPIKPWCEVLDFYNRRKVFTLLQGRLVARKNALRRLPVELFRMVATFLYKIN